MSSLFDPAFLRSLEGLRILARRVPAGGRHAEQRSRMRGGGVEFTDLRPYVPGDDFRAIDWHIYQRLDRLFLRLYLEDQDLPIYFLLDQSRSMAMPPPREGSLSKTACARQAVAALSYIALSHMDRVAVHPFAGKSLQPLPGISGKNALHRLLHYLAGLPAEGGTALVEALRGFTHRRRRRGLVVLVSDLFDPRGIEAVVEVLALVPHRLLILRPTHPKEDQPRLSGELQVLDCETGEKLRLSLDEALRRRYAEAYADFVARIEDLARRRSAGLLSLRTDQPVVAALASLFPKGVLQP